jgi:FlaA1/EpsC-like NDP-sugar epimerase
MDKILHFWRDREDRISRTWTEYKDNRYFELKLKYFFELDRDPSRPLVVWGAGRNGKDFIKVLAKYEQEIHWVCDNERKIGKEISGHQMQHFSSIKNLDRPQIIVVIAAPSAKSEIENQFTAWGKRPIEDFWFFA